MTIADAITAFFFRHQLRGQTRIHRLLLQSRRIEAKSSHGLVWQLDPYEYIDGFVLRHGFYEQEVLDAARERLRPGEVFWDVGANLGLHALTIKRMLPDVIACAFEPNPQLAGLIMNACKRNALDVNLVEVALDAKAGQARFYLHPGNAGRNGLHNWESDPNLRHIEVSTDAGDRVVSERRAPSPNVMKMDVEGNEQHVLAGMPELIHGNALHTVIFEDSVETDSPVKNILRAAGFAINQLMRQENTHHQLENYVARRDRTAK